MIGVQLTSLGAVGTYLRRHADGRTEPCQLKFEQTSPDDPAHSHLFGVFPCVKEIGTCTGAARGAFVALRKHERLSGFEPDDWRDLPWDFRSAADIAMLPGMPIALVATATSHSMLGAHEWLVEHSPTLALANVGHHLLRGQGYQAAHIVWVGNDGCLGVSIDLAGTEGTVRDTVAVPFQPRLLQRTAARIGRLTGIEPGSTQQMAIACESLFILWQESPAPPELVIGDTPVSKQALRAHALRELRNAPELAPFKEVLSTWCREPRSVYLLLGDLLGTALPGLPTSDVAQVLLPPEAHVIHTNRWLQRGLSLGAAYADVPA